MVTEATQNAQAAPGRAIPAGCDVQHAKDGTKNDQTNRDTRRHANRPGSSGSQATDTGDPHQRIPGRNPGAFFWGHENKSGKGAVKMTGQRKRGQNFI